MPRKNDWRYLARRVNGDGTETPLHNELPLSDVDLDKELSGPGNFAATLKPEFYGLRAIDGSSNLFVPWSTAIYAEKDGAIRRGYLLADVVDDGPALQLVGVDWSGYATDQPFDSEYAGVDADPLDIVRMLWAHMQGKDAGNLGLALQTTKTPIRVGKPEPPENAPASQTEGPYVLGWWETKDIGRVIDDLAVSTPFDYRTQHAWIQGTENISHSLELGYPSLGRRRTDLRFMVGENVTKSPKIDYEGDDYATSIIMLGAGEGRKMWRGISPEESPPGRLRRVLTLENKSLTSQEAVDRAAQQALALRQGLPDFSTFIVKDHKNARLFSYDVGDEIQVKTKGGWHDGLDLWVRIISISTNPQKMEDTLTVIRTDKVN